MQTYSSYHTLKTSRGENDHLAKLSCKVSSSKVYKSKKIIARDKMEALMCRQIDNVKPAKEVIRLKRTIKRKQYRINLRK